MDWTKTSNNRFKSPASIIWKEGFGKIGCPYPIIEKQVHVISCSLYRHANNWYKFTETRQCILRLNIDFYKQINFASLFSDKKLGDIITNCFYSQRDRVLKILTKVRLYFVQDRYLLLLFIALTCSIYQNLSPWL